MEWPAARPGGLEAALARGKGVVFVTGHVGNWELLARRVALAGFPSRIAQGDLDPRLTRLVERSAPRAGCRSDLARAGRRGAAMLRALRQGELLGLLIDQDTKVQYVFVPSSACRRATPRAAADLALRTGAALWWASITASRTAGTG